MEGCSSRHACNMVDRYHVESVDDARSTGELNATLEHANEEVVCVCD